MAAFVAALCLAMLRMRRRRRWRLRHDRRRLCWFRASATTSCRRTPSARQSEQGLETEAEVAFGIGAGDFTVAPSGKIIFKPGRRPADSEIRAFGTDVVIPRLREQLADLRALTPPAGDERSVAAVYDIAETGIDELEADPARFTDEGRSLDRAEPGAPRRARLRLLRLRDILRSVKPHRRPHQIPWSLPANST